MVAEPRHKNAYARREIIRTFGSVRIKEPQAVSHHAESSAVKRPLRYCVMHPLRIHRPNILSGVVARYALELSGRVSHVAHGVVAPVFAFRYVHAVHNYGCHSAHSYVAFASRFAHYEPCEQF